MNIAVVKTGTAETSQLQKPQLRESKADAKAFVAVDTVSLIPDFIEKFIETSYDAHAGQFETSTTLANREKFVVKERKN